MATMIAYCGLVCSDCEAYKATKANDDNLRKEIAAKWSKEYNHEMKPEDVNCDGCTVDGRHIGYCGMCQLRACAQEKKVKNCGWCAAYSCEKTDAFLKMVPQAKKNLDAAKGKR
jgi:hypothetical protein